MRNWVQHVWREGPVAVQKNPDNIVLIVPKLVGTSIPQVTLEAYELCNKIAGDLERRLGMELGRGEFVGTPHYEVGGDPVAESVSEYMVVRGAGWSIGDRSAPHIRGSVRLDDPQKMADYVKSMTDLPEQLDRRQEEITRRLSDIGNKLDRLLGDGVKPSTGLPSVLTPADNENQMECKIADEGDPLIHDLIDESHSFHPIVATSS